MPRGARLRVLTSAAVTILCAGSLVAFAMRAHGYPLRKMDLNDSGVWVTDDADGLVGRLNKSASSLDAMVNPPGGAQSSYALDVFQDQSVVVARDESAGRLLPIDVRTARVVPDGAVTLGGGDLVDMRGGTIAALDPASGKVYATRYDPGAPGGGVSLQALDGSARPVAHLAAAPATSAGSEYSALAVGVDGSVYAADRTGTVVTVHPDGPGFARVSSGTVRPAPPTDRGGAGGTPLVQVSAVGGHVVVLDTGAGTVSVDAGPPVPLGVPASQARLQQPGPDASDALVATVDHLLAVPIRGGSPRSLFTGSGGAPAPPVRLGSCVYGAWAGSPADVVRGCGSGPLVRLAMDRQGTLTRPVFRINRNEVVINDTADGRVFDLDLLRSVDNWQQIKPNPAVSQHQHQQKVSTDTRSKPKAVRDDLGARPGHSTVLHVLDNDSDASGRVLSILSVTKPGNPHASVVVAPDGQSLIYTLSAAGGDADFQYRISNGTAEAVGDVHVAAHGDGVNGDPYRRAGDPPPLTVAAGGTLPVQVLPDWRDPDGDPVALDRVDASAGTAVMTSDGRIEYTAPSTGRGGVQKITYAVTDGRGPKPISATVSITVEPPTATRGVPAITEPDVAKGQVGRPVAVHPLANDIPGADPLNPRAALALSGPVRAAGGVTVSTDLSSGQVLVTPDRVGTFFLSYSVGFGSAPLSTGQIRVDATAASAQAPQPVAMPDTAAVHGQGSVLVDVLANDVDPAGSLLTVQSAQADAADQVQVAVVKGRWLRLTPSTAQFATNPETVRYQVTNGLTAPVVGVVSVTQLPAVTPDSIVTRPDYATVRDGDSALIRVLDNDATLSGAQLSLLPDVPGSPAPGRLTVVDPSATGATGDLGEAYVAGDAIRYVAPAQVTQPRTVDVEYVAQTESGDRATGTLEVTVTPQPDAQNSDRAPTPDPIEARADAGETLSIPVPTTGTDPDGDSTAVVGIASAPRLGRVTGISPTTITYQAYPDAQGTDTFGYTITDRYGKQASSLIRVAVAPPAVPQPAVAAPEEVTAAPGATVTVYPLATAYYDRTDPVTVLPLDQTNRTVPAGVALDPTANAVTATTPPAGAKPLQVSYALTGNAGPGVPSTITVHSQAGFKNPPHVQDVTATPTGTPTVTVDVLATAYDPDGAASRLTVSRVGDPAAVVHGGSVTVPVTDRPQSIPYEVTDESGAVSAAVIAVPAQGVGGPYVKTGAVIRVPEGQPATVRLADYLADPRGRAISLTTTDQLWASPPAQLNVSASGKDRVTLTPTRGYTGPGALVAEVTDGTTLDDPQGVRGIVSIPVQVGPDTPVLRCPPDPVTVVAGGRTASLDITSLCSVWTPSTQMAAALTYTAQWANPLHGVTATARNRVVDLEAAGAAVPGQTGTLTIRVPGTGAAPGTLAVQVLAAPRPVLAPIQLQEMKQGNTRTVDVRDYLSSPLKDQVPTAVSVREVAGQAATASVSGSTVTITPGAASHGHMAFTVVASDVADPSRLDRQTSGVISFDVFGVPDAPARVQSGTSVLSSAASLAWTAPAANGAPIDSYEVSWSGGTQTCPSAPCTITGLRNGTSYTFRVRAHNKAGFSAYSPPSAAYTPDEAPQRVPSFTQTAAADHSVTLTWGAAANNGSPITDYLISVNGRTVSAGTGLSTTVSGLTNGQAYTFTIVAKNSYKAGPAATTTGYAAGAPVFSGPVTPQDVQPADADTTGVTVTWNAADPNGPEAPTYTMTRTGGGATKTVCTDVTATSCQDQGVSFGTTYTYAVVAKTVFLNTPRSSAPVDSSPYTPVGKPAPWQSISANATGTDNQISVTFTVPPSRGTSSTVDVMLNGGVSASLGSFATSGSGSTTRTVSVPSNGTDYSLALRDCNEKSQCSESNAVTVNAYGPIPAPSATLSKPGGTTFSVSVHADGNGRQITVSVRTDSGHSWSFNTTGGTDWSSGDYGVSYSQTDRAHVTISDSAGRGTPGQVDSNSQTADPPPQPSVGISFAGDASSRCGGCRYIVATLSNFSGTVPCQVIDSYGTPSAPIGDANHYAYWSQGNGTRQTVNYWGTQPSGAWVEIQCGGYTSPKHYGSS